MSEDKAKETTPKKPAADRAVKVMYLGPSIISPVPLTHRSVFTGGRPEFLCGLEKKVRDGLEACFVPLPEAGPALRELEGRKDAGKITIAYKAVESLLRGDK